MFVFRKSCRQFIGLLILFGLFFPSTLFAEVKTKAPGIKRKVYTSGIFLGTIAFVDPDGLAIAVLPIEQELDKRLFHVDSRTHYMRDQRRTNYSALKVGDKVAVRYIAEDEFTLAEAVFIVLGEFDHSQYLRRIKK